MDWDAIFTAYPEDAESIQGAKNLWESLRQSIARLELPDLTFEESGMDVMEAVPADKLARICAGVRESLYPQAPPVDMQQAMAGLLGTGDFPILEEELEEEILTLLRPALALFLTRLREHHAGRVPDPWAEGACPFCASFPRVAFDYEERRALHCPLCAHTWSFPRLKCPVCGNTDYNTLGYFEAEDLEGYRVAFCNECKNYLKVVDARQRTVNDAETEDVLTMELDELASQEGFSRHD